MDVDDQLTARCVKATSAALAFEMLGLLVRNQELEILKVTLALPMGAWLLAMPPGDRGTEMGRPTVEAPRPREDFLNVGVAVALLLAHGG